MCLTAILAAEVLLLSRSLGWLDHSNRVIAAGRQLGRDVSEMDTGLRGYFLSGDTSFLDSYRQAKGRVPGELDRLASMPG